MHSTVKARLTFHMGTRKLRTPLPTSPVPLPTSPTMSESDSDGEGDVQRQALPFPPNPPTKPKQSGPPATAAEYLRQGRQETAALPSILRSKTPAPPAKRLRRSYLPSPIPQPPHDAKPDPQWERDLVLWFAELQKKAASLPRHYEDVPKISEETTWESLLRDRPKPSLLLSMDDLRILRVLSLIDEHVKIVEDEDDSGKYVVPSLASGHHARWIFCLLSFVQPPISREMGAIIRSLLRKVAINMQDMMEDYQRKPAAILNVLLTILGKYFRQEDVH